MDADRFDTLAKRLSTPTSRRAALGAAVAGGVLGALGLTRSVPEAAAAQGQTCVLTFATTVRSGPSAGQSLAPGAQPGQLQGQLSFALSDSGSLDNATLTLADGTSLPVVGDATGHSLQLRIALGPQRALVAVGVGEQEIARCQGAIDGLVTGRRRASSGTGTPPRVSRPRAAASRGAARRRTARMRPRAGPRRPGATRVAPRAAATRERAAKRQGGGNPGGRGTQGANTQTCSAGLTACGDACVNLQLDSGNCGACGQGCSRETPICSGGRCVATEDAGPIQNCAPPFAFCDGVCVNLQTDPLNCGACGEECGVNDCTGGVCGEASASLQNCAPPFAVCGGACVDTSSDPLNCGACGVACAAGETCQQGACTATTTNAPALVCDAGLTDCGGTCVDLQTNDFHCGGCSSAARETRLPRRDLRGQRAGVRRRADRVRYLRGPAKRSEQLWRLWHNLPERAVRPRELRRERRGGTCVVPCPAGQTMCGDTCVDLSSDLFTCAVCGKSCNAGVTPSCHGGVCDNGGVCPDNPGGAC